MVHGKAGLEIGNGSLGEQGFGEHTAVEQGDPLRVLAGPKYLGGLNNVKDTETQVLAQFSGWKHA